MRAQRGGGGEVHIVGRWRDVVVGEQRAPIQFKVGRKPAVTLEVPLQHHRAEANAIRGIGRLEYKGNGRGIEGVLEASAENAGKMWVRENPTIAQSCIEDAGARCASGDRVASGCPNLEFVAASLRRGLGWAQA